MNQRRGSSIQNLRPCSLIKTRRTSQSTLSLRASQMPRRNSGSFFFWIRYMRINKNRENNEKKTTPPINQKERGYVRTRSENSQPTPKATNFGGSALEARRQLFLMQRLLPRRNARVLFGGHINCCPAKQVALVSVLTEFGLQWNIAHDIPDTLDEKNHQHGNVFAVLAL